MADETNMNYGEQHRLKAEGATSRPSTSDQEGTSAAPDWCDRYDQGVHSSSLGLECDTRPEEKQSTKEYSTSAHTTQEQ